jgi:hypothetical protein
MTSLYLIGSLRAPGIPELGNRIRKLGFDVFDDWFSPGPEADDKWKEYEQARGNTYRQALDGYAARHIFEFDHHHLVRADGAILAMPAGKSGHLELGIMLGWGKPGFIYYEGEPKDRWDVMHLFANYRGSGKGYVKNVCFNFDALAKRLKEEFPDG